MHTAATPDFTYRPALILETKPKFAFLGPQGTYSHQVSIHIHSPNLGGCCLPFISLGRTSCVVGRVLVRWFRQPVNGSGRQCNILGSQEKLLSRGAWLSGFRLIPTCPTPHICDPRSDVYRSVCSGECPVGLVPQENSIHGIVIETYDLLRVPDFGREVFVRGEVAIPIQHCLITRKGVALEDVKRVFSHEQALGQCGQFIRSHLKDAVLVKTPSTVAGVEAILNDDQYGSSSAAIASSVCERLFDGIQVLYKGIQDEKSNFTRFYVVARSLDWELPLAPASYSPCSNPSSRNTGLLRIREPETCDSSEFMDTGMQPSGGTRGGGLASLLSALDLQVCRLDRRPLLGAKTFAHVYIVEVDGGDQFNSAGSSPLVSDASVDGEFGEYGGDAIDLQSNKPLRQFGGDREWALRLREAANRVVEAGGYAEVLGCW